MVNALCLLYISLFLILTQAKRSSWDPIVETPSGKIRGFFKTSRSGLRYSAFLGIRYGDVNERFAVSVKINVFSLF